MKKRGPQHKKSCFVPGCTNTTISTPEKLFVSVPDNKTRKKKWFAAARRCMPTSKSVLFCCEDHFNLEEDMENYIRYKLIGGKIFFKQGVVPHIFDCQPDRKRASSSRERSLPAKLKRRRLVDDAIRENNKNQQNVPSTNVDKIYTSTAANETAIRIVLDTTKIPTQTSDDVKHIATSPFKRPTFKRRLLPKPSSSLDLESSSSFVTSASDDYIKELENRIEEQSKMLNTTHLLIQKKPKNFTGISDQWFPYITDLLQTETNISKENVMLTLMKIKLNYTFARLGDMFGMDSSNASRIFKKTLVQIETHLKTFIFWPSKEKIKYYLPVLFRARYNNVQSIINCLEIRIQKPTDPVKKALTWSECKKCNTLKYLISSTPDGFINFVSDGFGGRISDYLLVQECGYLEYVPSGSSVMADGGFKDVGKLLNNKKCVLIRPPSVSTSTTPTYREVLAAKRIVSLQLHIEKVIRRIREFEYLKPRSIINNNFISETNMVINIACALINLQSSCRTRVKRKN